MADIYKSELQEYVMGQERRRAIVIESDAPPGSLLQRALMALQDRSKKQIESPSNIYNMFNVARRLTGIAKDVLESPVEMLGVEEIREALTDFERALSQDSKLSGCRRSGLMTAFRSLLRLGATTSARAQIDLSIETHRSMSKYSRKRGIKKIFEKIYVDTISHASPAELVEKCRDATDKYKNELIKACVDEIEAYELLKIQQDELVSLPPGMIGDLESLASGRAVNLDSVKNMLIKIEKADDVERRVLMASSIWIDKRAGVKYLSPKRYSLGIGNYRPWLFAQYRLPNIVVFAIFLYFLVRTLWNYSSLARMTIDGIGSDVGRGREIQGFKSKTDDQTPIYEIAPSDAIGLRAINLLVWNRAQLIRYGIIGGGVLGLWHGWNYDNCGSTVINVDGARKRFIDFHGIDNFPLTDIRSLGAVNLYLTTENIEDIRVLLGHKDVVTSLVYLEANILDHLDRALIFEFIRRLEATAVFQCMGREGLTQKGIDQSKVNSALLVATGIGTKCIDPKSPPHLRTGRPCDGMHCLVGEGCINHRLMIDVEGVIIAQRTRQFYRYTWMERYNLNKDMFLKLDLPRIIFITALLAFTKDSRPDLYAEAESIIREEDRRG
ncbi:hypothetical protein [Pseudomonas sp.]|uniref:hypothetical protein n=1 Tax=Pseudomonas sp. TaxID=306 RepID=UPI003A983F21